MAYGAIVSEETKCEIRNLDPALRSCHIAEQTALADQTISRRDKVLYVRAPPSEWGQR